MPYGFLRGSAWELVLAVTTRPGIDLGRAPFADAVQIPLDHHTGLWLVTVPPLSSEGRRCRLYLLNHRACVAALTSPMSARYTTTARQAISADDVRTRQELSA